MPAPSTAAAASTVASLALNQVVTAICCSSLSSSRRANCQTLRPTRIWPRQRWRSEEHTSELQSHSDLVCRLLLEKKKKSHVRLARREVDQQSRHVTEHA